MYEIRCDPFILLLLQVVGDGLNGGIETNACVVFSLHNWLLLMNWLLASHTTHKAWYTYESHGAHARDKTLLLARLPSKRGHQHSVTRQSYYSVCLRQGGWEGGDFLLL